MDGYEVLSGELEAHASRVDGLTDRLRTAVDAGRQVSMNPMAFGVLCQNFAMMVAPFEQLGVNALQRGADTMADVGQKLHETVRGYDTTDTSESTVYRTLESQA